MKNVMRLTMVVATAFGIGCSAFGASFPENFVENGSFLTVQKEKNSNVLQILNNGTAAFAKRLELIEKAKKSIEVEYFIYSMDMAGKIFTQALIKKAREGVKVRVLIDGSKILLEVDEFIAERLRREGVEVRYYNTAFTLRPKSILYRNHRKLMVVDDQYAIVGGRNIANEYFDLDEEYNFLDRDAYTEGKIALSMRQTFDEYWDSEIVEQPQWWKIQKPKPSDNPNNLADYEARLHHWEKMVKHSRDVLVETDEVRDMHKKVMAVGARALKKEPVGHCGQLVFASDRPGTINNRILWNHLVPLIRETKVSLTADSPYFIIQKDGINIMRNLLGAGVDITVLTNSLNSTDAFYTVPVFKSRIKEHVRAGVNVYVYTGTPLNDVEYANEKAKEARWGVHSKTAVFDHNTIMIGTFNVDPRSKNLNTELALFCYDSQPLAAALESDIRSRLNNSVRLNNEGVPEDGRGHFYGASMSKRAMYFLMAPLTHVFDDLM